MISFDQQYVVSKNVLVREVDGEAVLLNVDSERYFGLDDVGTRVWAALTAGSSVQAAFDTLLQEYDVDANTLRDDLTTLLEQLVNHGLIESKDE
jgi:hypothetical protein